MALRGTWQELLMISLSRTLCCKLSWMMRMAFHREGGGSFDKVHRRVNSSIAYFRNQPPTHHSHHPSIHPPTALDEDELLICGYKFASLNNCPCLVSAIAGWSIGLFYSGPGSQAPTDRDCSMCCVYTNEHGHVHWPTK